MNAAYKVSIRLNYEFGKVPPSSAIPLLSTAVKNVPEMKVPQKEKTKVFNHVIKSSLRRINYSQILNVLDT